MRKFCGIFFLLSLVVTVISSQPSNKFEGVPADSVEKLLAVSKEDTNLVLMHSVLIMSYLNSNPKLAMRHAQDGVRLARKLNYKKGEADCLRRSGIVVQHQGRYAEALDIFLKAFQISK